VKVLLYGLRLTWLKVELLREVWHTASDWKLISINSNHLLVKRHKLIEHLPSLVVLDVVVDLVIAILSVNKAICWTSLKRLTLCKPAVSTVVQRVVWK
jgi:hypothetical protein